MIRKAIQYIKILCEGIEIDPRNPDPISGEFEKGSKDVADSVLKELGAIPAVYGVYEYNPYKKAPAPEKWEEIAVSSNPANIKDVAEALYKLHGGKIDLRYDSPEGVYAIRQIENGTPLLIRSEKEND